MSIEPLADFMDGRALASKLQADLRARVAAVAARRGRPPGLGLIQVGLDPASGVYVGRKEACARRLGLFSKVVRLPQMVGRPALLAQVEALNMAPEVDAFLVQMPLPGHLSPGPVVAAIDPAKDADGLHPHNLGQLVAGEAYLSPCTPAGIMALLAHYDVPLQGRHAVVVGRSAIVGRPMAAMLLRAHATVTHCHRHTQDLAAWARRADVLVVAVGHAELVKGAWIKPGAVVVDVGINRRAEGLVGDVEAACARRRARLITPVPGGVGPMTVAMLMRNAVAAAERSCGLSAPP